MADDWQMPRRSECCVQCERAFEPGQTVLAGLYETAAEYERRDYCEACGAPAEPPPIAIWRTRRPEPAASGRRAPFDKEAILACFERLTQPESSAQARLRFVLALLLWRKKMLRLEGSARRGAAEVWRFIDPKTDVSYEVERRSMDDEQSDRLSTQLERLLAGEEASAEPIAQEGSSERPDA